MSTFAGRPTTAASLKQASGSSYSVSIDLLQASVYKTVHALIVKTCTVMRKGKELNRSIGSKSLHHFVQRLLVQSVRQQVAKPQVLMRSQQNCSKQEERRYWTECTEYVWRSGKPVSGQRNGRSSHFPGPILRNFSGCTISKVHV